MKKMEVHTWNKYSWSDRIILLKKQRFLVESTKMLFIQQNIFLSAGTIISANRMESSHVIIINQI